MAKKKEFRPVAIPLIVNILVEVDKETSYERAVLDAVAMVKRAVELHIQTPKWRKKFRAKVVGGQKFIGSVDVNQRIIKDMYAFKKGTQQGTETEPPARDAYLDGIMRHK